jgi:hypothetical protein
VTGSTTIPTEAWAALIGAAVGWFLGFLSESVTEALRHRRARRVAALLIYGELFSNLAAVSALRKYGVWSTGRIHRSAWEAQAPALLYRSNVDRVGKLSIAYNSLEDVSFLATDESRDFTQGDDAEFLDDTVVPVIYQGMREVGPLTGLKAAEVEQRIAASKRLLEGQSEQADESGSAVRFSGSSHTSGQMPGQERNGRRAERKWPSRTFG